LKACQEQADSWSDVVEAHILHVHDLHAADTVYHQACSVNFCTKKHIPTAQIDTEASERSKLGCLQEDKRVGAFLEVASYLEDNDDEQITINDLIDLKQENTDYNAYSYIYMKSKLQEHFGERIVQTEINGKPNVLTFRTTARKVLQDYYSKQQQQEKDNTSEEKN